MSFKNNMSSIGENTRKKVKNNYKKILSGVLLGTALMSSSALSAADNTVETKLLNHYTNNSIVSLDLNYGGLKEGNSSNSTFEGNLDSNIVEIYTEKENGGISYFDLGVGLDFVNNKNKGTFTFGADYLKKMNDIDLKTSMNYVDIFDNGHGYALNLDAGIKTGNLNDDFSNQEAKISGHSLSVGVEGLLNVKKYPETVEFLLGVEYQNNKKNFSKSPTGLNQAIDSRSNTLDFNGRVLLYDHNIDSLIDVGANAAWDIGLGVRGGFFFNTEFPLLDNYGKLGVEYSKEKDKDILIGKLGYDMKNFGIDVYAKGNFNQTNPNVWQSPVTGGIVFNYHPENLKKVNNDKLEDKF